MGYGDRYERRARRGHQERVVRGYTSQLILYPSTDSGVFVSFNANYGNGPNSSAAVAYQVAESIYQATRTGSVPGG